ncbi:MAG: hypothetical protein ACOYNW_04040 [Undibacterium curvum]|uniref:hypothetical protein n=1 Tax=Undibacterium curvum TaxID=2762294 RepID=UPI003BE29D16
MAPEAVLKLQIVYIIFKTFQTNQLPIMEHSNQKIQGSGSIEDTRNRSGSFSGRIELPHLQKGRKPGFAEYHYSDSKRTFELKSIEANKRRDDPPGMGKRLLQQVEQVAANTRADTIHLTTNQPGFFKKAGFEYKQDSLRSLSEMHPTDWKTHLATAEIGSEEGAKFQMNMHKRIPSLAELETQKKSEPTRLNKLIGFFKRL